MNTLDQILSRYPAEDVKAAAPVIAVLGLLAAPVNEIPPPVLTKLLKAADTVGLKPGASMEETALAIDAYCQRAEVNPELLSEIALTYRDKEVQGALNTAAARRTKALKAVGAKATPTAPKVQKKKAEAKVKASRGLKKR
ncbi:MAG: hypothetical protein A2138_00555 [Deltaproteobacteria bacterium RBG_16_71_12]|nr:MAG: hypothetical protein A2138_00555 [Deltaproteobacteria bacterium RBG_16_71_12]